MPMRGLILVLSLHVAACDSQDAAKPAETAPAKPEPASTVPPAAPQPEKFGDEFCATIIPCFEKHDFNGSFTADVTIDIEPEGTVASVSYTGDAPKPVQDCIVQSIEPIKLGTYNGKPGRTRCTQSGQLSGGTRMVMSDLAYEVR